MAKNLKLKIKNNQLATAIQLKKKKTEKTAALKKAPPKAKLVKPTTTIQSKTPLNTKKETTPIAAENPLKNEPSLPEKTPIQTSKVLQQEKKNEQPSQPFENQEALPKEQPPNAKPLETATQASPKVGIKKDNKEPPKKENGFQPQFARTLKDYKSKKNEARQSSGFDARDRLGLRVGEERSFRTRRFRNKRQYKEPVEVIRPTELTIRLPITVKDLAQSMKRKASELIAKLFKEGISLTINDNLEDPTTVELLGHEFECEINIDTKEEKRLRITDKTIAEEIQDTQPENLQPRPPIIAFMGHVDHGKTSLIDSIRKSNLAGSESGAITQHIGAFTCHQKSGDITILDTPGHEAFTLMRKRGASITDVVVLVIAGDEGIMPQTDEAINQAKQAEVSIIVAINKCDKPSFDSETVYRQLADRELLPEAWGGDVITVNCSATSGEGVTDLLEMLSIQTDILELKANPKARARGSVIESQMHKGFGAVATVLVQNGTLKVGDAIILEDVYGRIKTMHDEHGKSVAVAPPSTPIKITGLSGVPLAGCEFIYVEDEKEARKICEDRVSGLKRSQLMRRKESLEVAIERHKEVAEKKVLNLILKADVQGSLEAIKSSLFQIKTKKVLLNFIYEGVGEVTESDVELSDVSNAPIIAFHTSIEGHAEQLVKNKNVVIKQHNIIYQIIDEVKKLMLETLDKVRQENEMGTFIVKQLFKVSQLGVIAGGQVLEGLIKRNHFAKVIRNDQVIWEGQIASLKRVKEDVKEVSKGLECGILLERFNNLETDDIIKTFEITYITQDL